MTWFAGKKTYLIAGLSIAGAIGAYLQGTMDLQGLISACQTAILAVTIRQGITTSNK